MPDGTMNPLPLLRVDGVFRFLVVEVPRGAVGSMVFGWADSGLVVRVVRGRKMRTVKSLFEEFAAALQFPLYFGENKDSFDDCITDLAWLPHQAGLVLLVTEPLMVLTDEPAEELAWLGDALGSAADEWGEPIELGEWWDRPAVPFHIVLACTPDTVPAAEQHWARSGVQVAGYGSKPS